MRKLKNSELGRLDLDAFKNATKTPVTLVLDNVRSALNVGSAFRTADAFLIEQIILCGITAQPPHRDIQKTALGATDSIKWQYFSEVTEAAQYLKQQQYHLLAIEQMDEKTYLNDFQVINDKYALFFGNEVKGISDDLLPFIDACIEIPQFGSKHSLNISVSIGVVLWDFFTKMRANN